MDQDPPVWLIPLVLIFVFVILGLVVLFFVPTLIRIARNSRMTRQVMQTGVDATATIVHARDTGVRINDNPQVGLLLQVQPPGGVPFQAEVTKTVSIVELPMFQPGAHLQVKYDPANPSRVAIISVVSGGVATAAPMGSPLMNLAQAEQMMTQYQIANEHLLKTGVAATAIVMQYLPLGINVNGNNAAVNLVVQVHPTHGAAFTAQAPGNVLAETAVPKFQPGQMITIRYNPGDLTKVAVERSGV